MKKYRILSCCLASAVWLLAAPMAFAEAPVVEDSQNYVLNNAETDSSDQQPMIHDDQDARPPQNSNNNYMQQQSQNTADTSGYAGDSQDPALLLSKLNALQQQIQQMHGQLEVQAHQIEALQKQQQDYYKDLDSRISSGQASKTTAKATPATDTTTTTSTASTTNNVAHPAGGLSSMDEQASYAAAYDLLRNKQFDDAIVKMKSFVQNYPNSENIVNAHYWLGELYLAKQQPKLAIDEFNIVLNKYPGSLKTDAAMMKLGYAYADVGNYAKAKELLTKVTQRFPNTTAAKLAANRLAMLKQNGK